MVLGHERRKVWGESLLKNDFIHLQIRKKIRKLLVLRAGEDVRRGVGEGVLSRGRRSEPQKNQTRPGYAKTGGKEREKAKKGEKKSFEFKKASADTVRIMVSDKSATRKPPRR